MRKSAAAATLLLLALAAGCGGGGSGGVVVNSPSSPLGNGGDWFQVCVPDPSGTTMTNGFTVLQNVSKGTVVIEQVSFYGDQHLQLADAVVVAVQNGPLVGMAAGWPPPAANLAGVQWARRVAAVGARIPPGAGESAEFNLVIAMRPTAREATATGVQVLYRENSTQYELRTHTEFMVLAAKSC